MKALQNTYKDNLTTKAKRKYDKKYNKDYEKKFGKYIPIKKKEPMTMSELLEYECLG